MVSILLTESMMYGAKECATIPKIWINDTPWDLTGVGKSSAAYWSPTLADMFRQNRDITDITSLAVAGQQINQKWIF